MALTLYPPPPSPPPLTLHRVGRPCAIDTEDGRTKRLAAKLARFEYGLTVRETARLFAVTKLTILRWTADAAAIEARQTAS